MNEDSRKLVSFPITADQNIKLKMLNWANRFNIFCFLDNHQYASSDHAHEVLVAAGARDIVNAAAGDAFAALKRFSDRNKDWLFGHFGFGLAQETEGVTQQGEEHAGFADLFFFVPELVIELSTNEIRIHSFGQDHQIIFDEIMSVELLSSQLSGKRRTIDPVMSRDDYISSVRKILGHIFRGDCYEMNFCQEFVCKNSRIEPVEIYQRLSALSPTPYSAYYRVNSHYLLCSSPERYLAKRKQRVIAQPIKGTAARDRNNSVNDQRNKKELEESIKDRSENVMIVDLVRNDLSRFCVPGSVRADDMFAIYSFPQVFQMISTISGEPLPAVHWTDMIRSTFPMGSMTGAPKRRVLELINNFEHTRRGLFSGAVGYVTPDQDFDFNVVIRSIQANTETDVASYHAGSAITSQSDPEKEYEECMLKGAAIRAILIGDQ